MSWNKCRAHLVHHTINQNKYGNAYKSALCTYDDIFVVFIGNPILLTVKKSNELRRVKSDRRYNRSYRTIRTIVLDIISFSGVTRIHDVHYIHSPLVYPRLPAVHSLYRTTGNVDDDIIITCDSNPESRTLYRRITAVQF